jgi:plastocyanin
MSGRVSLQSCILAAVVSGLVGSLPSGAASVAGKPTTHTVTIEATDFKPSTLTVKAGDTVVWQNKDPFPHTATSEAGRFDSQKIDPGGSWQYKADKPGEFPYLCSFHPGRVVPRRPSFLSRRRFRGPSVDV